MNVREIIKKIKGMMGLSLRVRRIPLWMDIPDDIMKISDIFKGHGYLLYIVGGAVRDTIKGEVPKDYDLVTDADPDDVERILHERGYRTIPTGRQFGVINVVTRDGEYEIARMREDIGSGRRPESVRFADIETDVMRRDLTINALYYDINSGEVIDFVGGYDDIKNNVVRTVGNPDDRFSEDRLRILRAIRFAARMGSDLDDGVKKSLSKDSGLYKVSGERIRDEFIKGIKSSLSVRNFLSLLDGYKLFDWIFPGLRINRDFKEEKNVVILVSLLLRDNDVKRVTSILNKVNYSVIEVRDIEFLITLIGLDLDNVITMKRAQSKIKLSDDEIMRFGRYVGMDEKLLSVFLRFKLTIKGEDLMRERGMKQGRELGDLINKMEHEKFMYEFTGRS